MQIRESMWRNAEARAVSEETSAESFARDDVTTGLFQEMRCLLAPHGVRPEALAAAFNDVTRNQARTGFEAVRDLREPLAGLVLWRLFGRESALWIHSKTQAGNEVTTDLLVAAYTMWTSAVNVASKQGVDSAAAAGALAQAVHATADKHAKNLQHPDLEPIGDIRKYIFASYMYSIYRMTRKEGVQQVEYVDMAEWVARRELSDQGAFLAALESRILCREVLEAMPPKGKSVAVARYILGYSWTETAGAMNSSVNTVQKALSSGIRKAVGACMNEIRKMGSGKVRHIESYLRNKGNQFSEGEQQ